MTVDTSTRAQPTVGEPGAVGATPRLRPGRRVRTARRPRSWAPLILLAPAGAVLAVVLGYPLVRLVVNSFQDFGLRALFTGDTEWIGFANYAAVFSDPQFGPVLVRTAVFTLSLVIGCLIIGMAMSQMMFLAAANSACVSRLSAVRVMSEQAAAAPSHSDLQARVVARRTCVVIRVTASACVPSEHAFAQSA